MAIEHRDQYRRLYLGPARNGDLLEIVAILRRDRPELAIHAMKMRSKYRRSPIGRLKEMAKKAHGETVNGIPITDELIGKLVEEAESGFDVDEDSPSPRGTTADRLGCRLGRILSG